MTVQDDTTTMSRALDQTRPTSSPGTIGATSFIVFNHHSKSLRQRNPCPNGAELTSAASTPWSARGCRSLSRVTAPLVVLALLLSLTAPATAQDPQTDPTALSESRQITGWTLVGGGALFILGGFAAGLRVNDFDERISDLQDEPQEGERPDEARINALQEDRELMALVRSVGFIGGLSLLAGGATILIYDASVTHWAATAHLKLTPWTHDHAQGFMLEGRF